MYVDGAVLFGILGLEVNKSIKIDEQATKKNVKAFTKMAEADRKLEQSQKKLYERLAVNAKRKRAILSCHIVKFQNQYSKIRKIQFKEGRGVRELEELDELNLKLTQSLERLAISGGRVMKDTQLVIILALKGIGGMAIQDSKMNLKLASRNVTKANAVSAEADLICVALDGIREHVDIVTQLLEGLGMLYIKSITNVEQILTANGLDELNYSDKDIEALNLTLDLTRLIYRIINMPLIDEEGKIEEESIKAITEGQNLLKAISKEE